MKKSWVGLAFLVLGRAHSVQGQGYSVSLESKTVYPQAGTGGAVRMKVYITNPDSVSYFTLVLSERSTSGGAYMTLAYPRTFFGVVTPLINTLRHFSEISASFYNNSGPDSFLVGAGFDPSDRAGTLEPPNLTPKAVWEIKFDTVFNNLGTIEFNNSCCIGGSQTTLTDSGPTDHKLGGTIFKSVVTVAAKGDLNLDVEVSPADVVWELLCVINGGTPPVGRGFCDLNCDGEITASDIVWMLYYTFMSVAWPC